MKFTPIAVDDLTHTHSGIAPKLMLPAILLCPVLACVALDAYSKGNDEIATINCGSGREVVFSVSRSWEGSPTMYYDVRVNGRVVVPTTHVACVGTDTSGLHFDKITDAGGDLVRISFAGDIEYLVMHDFKDNSSWPRGDHVPWDRTKTVDDNNAVHKRMRLAAESRLPGRSADR